MKNAAAENVIEKPEWHLKKNCSQDDQIGGCWFPLWSKDHLLYGIIKKEIRFALELLGHAQFD